MYILLYMLLLECDPNRLHGKVESVFPASVLGWTFLTASASRMWQNLALMPKAKS